MAAVPLAGDVQRTLARPRAYEVGILWAAMVLGYFWATADTVLLDRLPNPTSQVAWVAEVVVMLPLYLAAHLHNPLAQVGLALDPITEAYWIALFVSATGGLLLAALLRPRLA